jgi:hypothetical protein
MAKNKSPKKGRPEFGRTEGEDKIKKEEKTSRKIHNG